MIEFALALALPLILASSPAGAVCPAVNSYPFTPGCPLPADELNKALGGSGGIVNPVDYDPLCGGQTTEAEIALTPPTAHDCTVAINLAATILVNGRRAKVRLQAGRYYITDSILLDGSQMLSGDGKGTSIVRARDTFSPAAEGVVVMGNTGLFFGTGEILEDFAMAFDQPDTPTGGRAGAASLGVCDSGPTGTICKYPPAVLMKGAAARHNFRNLRIQKAWDGIAGDAVATVNNSIQTVLGAVDNGSGLIRLTVASTAAFGTVAGVANVGGVPNATGRWTITIIDATHLDLVGSTFAGAFTSGGTAIPNSGNQLFNIHNLEISALNKGLWIDGVRDQSMISGFHFWNFGIPGTSALYTVMTDGNTDCMNLGELDGALFVNVFCHRVVLRTITSLVNAPSSIVGEWANVALDGGSFIAEDTQHLEVSNLSGSGGGGTFACLVNVQSGSLFSISNYAVANVSTTSPLCVSGGVVNVNGGQLSGQPGLNTVLVTGGTARIRGVHFGAAETNRTVAIVQKTAGSLLLMNGSFPSPGVATGVAIATVTDAAGDWIAGNKLSGWPISLGCGATIGGWCYATMNGFYDLPDTPFTMGTITPEFGTPGDFVPANIVEAGRWWLRGDHAEYKLSYEFDTNAYTTAAGTFFLNTALPVPLNPSTMHAGCTLSLLDNVALAGAVQTMCHIGALPGPVSFTFPTFISGAASGLMGAASFPASTTDFRLDLFGRYQIR